MGLLMRVNRFGCFPGVSAEVNVRVSEEGRQQLKGSGIGFLSGGLDGGELCLFLFILLRSNPDEFHKSFLRILRADRIIFFAQVF